MPYKAPIDKFSKIKFIHYFSVQTVVYSFRLFAVSADCFVGFHSICSLCASFDPNSLSI